MTDTPITDTRTLHVGDPITLAREGTVVTCDGDLYEVRFPQHMLIETFKHNDPAVTITRHPQPLPVGFGALVEADVPHPHREGAPYVRTFLTRTAGGHWETRHGWTFSDPYLTNVHVHHHGAPIQGAGITDTGELVTL